MERVLTSSSGGPASSPPVAGRRARSRRWAVVVLGLVVGVVAVTAVVVGHDRDAGGPCESIAVSVTATPVAVPAAVDPQRVLIAQRVSASGMAASGWDGPSVVILEDGTAIALSSFSEDDGARFRRATLPIATMEQIRACISTDGFRSLEAGATVPGGGSCRLADASTSAVSTGPASGHMGIVRSVDLDRRTAPPCPDRPVAFTGILDALARTERLVMTQGEPTAVPPQELAPG